ncbi:hypothetical protein NECID01_1156 [Nematocida sp. AWRm77]|nr:hypothetical protein NECID01_1156 [Nematocida sp. AWRm77]
MKTRDFLYNGECVFVYTTYDGVKLSSGKGTCEYILGNRMYQVASNVDSITIEHVEFSKDKTCTEPYCVSSVINSAEENIVQSRKLSVVPPFSIEERIRGNHLEVVLVPDKDLPAESACSAVVCANGVRMEHRNGRYYAKLTKLGLGQNFLFIGVSYQQIQYVTKSLLSFPDEFVYTVGMKRVGTRRFIRVVLCRADSLSRYAIRLLNPLYGSCADVAAPGRTTSADISTPDTPNLPITPSTPDTPGTTKNLPKNLLVCASTDVLEIEEPDKVTELFFEVRSVSGEKLSRQALGPGSKATFSLEVNGFPVHFTFKLQ